MEEVHKCHHATCSCPALPGEDFCGAGCREAVEKEEAGEEPLSGCKCAHPDCGGEAIVPPEVQGLAIASEALAQA